MNSHALALEPMMYSPSISDLVSSASDVISPVWPLKTFIAVNPLQGLVHLPIEQAVARSEMNRRAGGGTGYEAVNREMIKWCTAYFDEGQATISMPERERGLYGAFVALARYDRRVNRSKRADQLLRSLPESAEDAIAGALEAMQVEEDRRELFLRQSFAALPGWAGFVRWKEQWQSAAEQAKRPATLVDFMAVRLVLTQLLWPEAASFRVEAIRKPSPLAALATKEAVYRKTLLQQLMQQEGPRRKQSDAQLVFCIDVRSEQFRRALESRGRYETYGFAGFFGLPVQLKELDAECPHDSCPVLLKPNHVVCEQAAVKDVWLKLHNRGLSLQRAPRSLYQWLKYSFSTPFALVEMLGPWLGLRMFARTFAPLLASRVRSGVGAAIVPAVQAEPDLASIEVQQLANWGESALRTMGLTDNFAPLVVFCGHGSSTTNNAYASALDCGACGGNPGGGNARILASILNQSTVRSLLAERGLLIPAETLFVAAEHDTTLDRVELYEPRNLCEVQRGRLASLREDLAEARIANAQHRTATFGIGRANGPDAVCETERRGADWAEVRPEWGLARNATFIVGPRALTNSINLEGRAFLHSYDWINDSDGKFLTTILTAPMVVAHWINSQYLFSTLDNVAYGAGSKVTQNVTGKLGVMQGNASDLMHGLPLQSLFVGDGKPYHEPLRLLTVVYAPRTRLDAIIASQPVLKELFGNGWVTLSCLDPHDGDAYLLTRELKWTREC